jgi:cytochrome b subunit of formate dehydrogenase
MMQEVLAPTNRNLYLFFIITFAFSWLLWLPIFLSSLNIIQFSNIFNVLNIIGSFGPIISAISLTLYNEGLLGAKILWSKG